MFHTSTKSGGRKSRAGQRHDGRWGPGLCSGFLPCHSDLLSCGHKMDRWTSRHNHMPGRKKEKAFCSLWAKSRSFLSKKRRSPWWASVHLSSASILTSGHHQLHGTLGHWASCFPSFGKPWLWSYIIQGWIVVQAVWLGQEGSLCICKMRPVVST